MCGRGLHGSDPWRRRRRAAAGGSGNPAGCGGRYRHGCGGWLCRVRGGADGLPDAAQAITLAGGAYIQATDGLQRSADYETAPDAVLLPQGTGTLTYELEVPQTALYALSLRYASLEGNGLDIRVGLRIDGEYPFSEAGGAELSAYVAQ